MMEWNGAPGWVGWLLGSVGLVAFWASAAMAHVPRVKDNWAHRGRYSGGLR